MPTLDFPANIRPARVRWKLRTNTQIHRSPLSGVPTTYELPGARWEAVLEFRDLRRSELAALEVLLAKLRGPAGRVRVWNHARELPSGTGQGEPARSNYGTPSERFYAWVKNDLVVIDDYATAPDGSLSASKIIPTAISAQHRIVKNAMAGTWTWSVHLRADEIALASIQIWNITQGVVARVGINLATGAQSGAPIGTVSITPLAGGWYRVAVTATVAYLSTFMLYAGSDVCGYYTGNGAAGVLAWGAQIEDGNTLSAYIPAHSTFTSRASTATYWGSDGLLQTAAIDEARMQYNPLNLRAPPKLLLEAEATNLVPYSSDFGRWSSSSMGVTIDTRVAPNGAIEADTLTATGTSYPRVERAMPIVTSPTFRILSVFVARGSNAFAALGHASPSKGAVFNLDTLSVASVTGTIAAAGVVDVGNGFRRVWICFPCNITDTWNVVRILQSAGVSHGQGEVDGYLYAWGAQVEDVGALFSVEKVANGTFDTDAAYWVPQQATLAAVAGELEVTSTATNLGIGLQTIAVNQGKLYRLEGYARKGTAGTNALISVWDGVTHKTVVLDVTGDGTTGSLVFEAMGASVEIKLIATVTDVGQTAYFDNISLKEITPSRVTPSSYIPTLSAAVTRAADVSSSTASTRPQGPAVDGAGQTGTTLATQGWTPNVLGVLLAGDYFAVNGELKMLTEDANSDFYGKATLTFEPPLRNPPPDEALITIERPTAVMMLADDEQVDIDYARSTGSLSLRFVEAIE